jgi:hypothetical protein
MHLQILVLIIQMSVAHTNTLIRMENKNIYDYNSNMWSALNWKYKLFNVQICICCGRAFGRPVIFTGGLLSALSFSQEGFCPPCQCHGRAFVRLVIFTGGLLSTLSILDGRAFVWEGFCPTLGFNWWGFVRLPFFAYVDHFLVIFLDCKCW